MKKEEINRLLDGKYNINGSLRFTSSEDTEGIFIVLEMDTEKKEICCHAMVPKTHSEYNTLIHKDINLPTLNNAVTDKYYCIGHLMPKAEHFTDAMDEANQYFATFEKLTF